MTIWIPPLPAEFLERTRSRQTDDQDQPVRRITAEGGEPCRDVLRRARPGEELLLASFTPFGVAGPFKEYGPVYLLANGSDEAVSRDVLPVDGYLREQFVIRAYSADEDIVNAAMTSPTDAMQVAREFFESPNVAFLHVRFPTYGCFACRVDVARVL